ncbi:hypothetical protein Tco_0677839 [Tanacetum coccineum]|uniref:Uncharacterized protein n=1 Tax=Tanacetum coccineum TaxID=301880 RepID=A0ABQ4XE20_9ASTR
MNKVAKTIGLIDAIAKINDPQCELLLLRSCTGISRLHFIMRTCPIRVFESAQCSFGVALCSSLERIFTAFGPEFSDWVFAGDIYGDHVVSCAMIIGIKHRHNVVRDTLVDICYRSGISAGKEIDIGLDGGRHKPLRELEANAVTLLKRIRKFSMTEDIGARAAAHIFTRTSFAIAKGVKGR